MTHIRAEVATTAEAVGALLGWLLKGMAFGAGFWIAYKLFVGAL